jgi:hypothetical protein
MITMKDKSRFSRRDGSAQDANTLGAKHALTVSSLVAEPSVGRVETAPQHHAARRPLTVTIKVGCELLGIGRTTMAKLTKSGQVESIWIGRSHLLVYASLEKLAGLPVNAPS